MKIKVFVFGIIPLLCLSCGGLNKKMTRSGGSGKETPVVSAQKTEAVPEKAQQEPIVERTEKLVEAPGIQINPSKFFVIIGSFQSLENAKTQVGESAARGFVPVILKSESGYFRVSVMATDDEAVARNEIYRIKYLYPEHADTWLLIQQR